VSSSDTESSVREFYNEKGWQESGGVTTDARLWEDLRPVAAEYVRACRLRILNFLPDDGDRLLDAGCGPIQYDEYLRYSDAFCTRVCVDISERALERARERVGGAGEFVRASLLELPFEDETFDATVSLHTIFHIDRDDQERAVAELLRVTKKNAPVVIVYANPNRLLGRIKRTLKRRRQPELVTTPVYYYAHPLSWWRRFMVAADVEIVSWRSLNARESRVLIPDNVLGRLQLRLLLRLEGGFPHALARLGAYVIVVLTPRR
jgi:SAM-dependent methyltransferase